MIRFNEPVASSLRAVASLADRKSPFSTAAEVYNSHYVRSCAKLYRRTVPFCAACQNLMNSECQR